MPGDACDPREVTALILAAGEGRRMGNRPKAFIQFRQRTLLARALAAVSPWASRVVIGVSELELTRARALVASLPEAADTLCVVGGATRQETLGRVLERANTRFVLVHEVARAWTSATDIRNILAAVRVHPAAILFEKLKVRDSVALLDGQNLGAVLPRNAIITLQTPHAYERTVLQSVYSRAQREGIIEESTAALVQHCKIPIHLVESQGGNFKMTYPTDLRRTPKELERR